MINIQELKDIQIVVKEAFDDMIEIGTDVLGIYNYIRNCNEDFGDDMYINEDILPCDNTEIQHCYLVYILFEAFKRGCIVPNVLLDLFNENQSYFKINLLEEYIQFIQQRMTI